MSAAHTTLIFEKVVLGNIAPCIFFARRNVPFSIVLKPYSRDVQVYILSLNRITQDNF